MLKRMLGLNDQLNGLGILSCFVGPFTQELIAELGSSLRDSMKENQESSSYVVKVFSVVVELSQNILHYSSETEIIESSDPPESLPMGMLAAGKQDSKYFVLSGNLLKKEKAESLVNYLEELNMLDKQELRKLYNKKRRLGPSEGSKGAGLGFIEMARKASSPLEYSVHMVDENHSFFSIKVLV
ncbi:MAG: hypothetical protein CR997_09435 [Acidobacteria bacterium]|nr:MAG: hypothetical protein CR997_09435 [Acidobacteriota bacterium]